MDIFEKTINRTNIYSGKIIDLDIYDVILSNNKIAKREIINHPGGVAILPVTSNNEIYLVKQFRKPYECEVLEIPAGKLEKNEEPEACGIRELKEETGLTASKVTFLTEMYPSPGYTNEKIYIFKAEDLEEGENSCDEDEFLNVYKIHINDAFKMIEKGLIKDAKSIIAILMYIQAIKL